MIRERQLRDTLEAIGLVPMADMINPSGKKYSRFDKDAPPPPPPQHEPIKEHIQIV